VWLREVILEAQIIGAKACEKGVAKRQIMRNGQNKRMRGRNNNNNRKSSNPLTRVYESNGPDVKIRGTASHVAEKYIQLARDSQASGDPVAAENYYQHAEHYFRMIAAAQEQFRQGQQQPFQRPEGGEQQRDDSFDGEDDEFQGQGEPGYVNREPQAPFPPRDNQFQQRDQQPHYNQQPPYPRDQQQPRPQQQGDGANEAGGLPSFITGGAQQGQGNSNYGQNGYEGQADRYPLHRRRRRHRGPRNDMQGGSQNDGNQLPRPNND
jgi:hypothetical protein